jgi:cyclopropane fatty-acyl-phospholipid synthase-like methyltransferase
MEETMKNRFLRFFQYMVLTCLAFALLCVPLSSQRAVSQAFPGEQEKIKLDVPYEPSSEEVVGLMLDVARVGKTDLVYDLGCGDGRVVIAAAQKRGARGVGVDLDPERIKESMENGRKANSPIG